MADTALLYLHIPFCKQKCAYCDFASYAGRDGDMARVCAALVREMKMRAAQYGRLRVETVFLGGGTPTLLSGDAVAELLSVASECFDLSACTEITMEGNPGTLSPDALRAYRRAGVNRLSLGAQAGQDALLARLGRIHRWADVEAGVAMARDAGFDNLSLDLMYGLPGQTAADFEETLAMALALKPQHLSCYSLIVEEGTPFYARYSEADLPDEEEEERMNEAALRLTAQAGMHQYEISNYTLPGFECHHNIGYWTRKPYLGVGPAAHSFLQGERFGNTPSLDAWLAAIESGKPAESERTRLIPEDERFEHMMLGLRLTAGISQTDFSARYGASVFTCYCKVLETLRAQGLMDWDDAHLWLTPRGLRVQNAVLVQLLG